MDVQPSFALGGEQAETVSCSFDLWLGTSCNYEGNVFLKNSELVQSFAFPHFWISQEYFQIQLFRCCFKFPLPFITELLNPWNIPLLNNNNILQNSPEQ